MSGRQALGKGHFQARIGSATQSPGSFFGVTTSTKTHATALGLTSSGDAIWSFRGSISIYDMYSDGTYTWMCGNRTTLWGYPEIATPSNMSVWKLDAQGEIVWTQDTGGAAFGLTVMSGYVYVAGQANTSWPGAGGVTASMWKLSDIDGSISIGKAPTSSTGASIIYPRGLCNDGTNIYMAERTGNWSPVKLNTSCNVVSDRWAIYGSGSSPADRIVLYSGNTYETTMITSTEAGHGATDRAIGIRKTSTAGTTAWNYDGGGNYGAIAAPLTSDFWSGIAVDSSGVYACGYDVGGTDQDIVMLNLSGAEQWDHQHYTGSRTATRLCGIVHDGSSIWVSGDPSSDWTDTTQYASVWKLNDSDRAYTNAIDTQHSKTVLAKYGNMFNVGGLTASAGPHA